MARKPTKSNFKFSAEALLAEMPTVSFICENDEFYTMRYISHSLRGMLGYQPEEFIDNAKSFAASVVHPDDLEVVDAFAEAAMAANEPVIARYRLVRHDSTVLPCLMVSRAVRDASTGEAVGFCGTAIDVSREPALQGPACILTAPKQT